MKRILHSIIDKFRKKKVMNVAISNMYSPYPSVEYDRGYIYYRDVVYFVSIKHKVVKRVG